MIEWFPVWAALFTIGAVKFIGDNRWIGFAIVAATFWGIVIYEKIQDRREERRRAK